MVWNIVMKATFGAPELTFLTPSVSFNLCKPNMGFVHLRQDLCLALLVCPFYSNQLVQPQHKSLIPMYVIQTVPFKTAWEVFLRDTLGTSRRERSWSTCHADLINSSMRDLFQHHKLKGQNVLWTRVQCKDNLCALRLAAPNTAKSILPAEYAPSDLNTHPRLATWIENKWLHLTCKSMEYKTSCSNIVTPSMWYTLAPLVQGADSFLNSYKI